MSVKITKPVKFTDEVSAKLEHAAAIDADWEDMAFYAEISKSTLYNWLASIDGLKERLDALKNKPILKARKVLVDNLDKGKVETAKWYLERKKKDEFSARTEQKHDGEVTFVINEGSEDKPMESASQSKVGDERPIEVQGDEVRAQVREDHDGNSKAGEVSPAEA
jgi:hypothetical protein